MAKEQIKIKHSTICEAVDDAIRRFTNEEIDMGQVISADEREANARYRAEQEAKLNSSPKVVELRRKIRNLRHMFDEVPEEEHARITAEIQRTKEELNAICNEILGGLNESVVSDDDKEYKTVDLDGETTLRVALYTVKTRSGWCEYAEGYIFTPEQEFNSVGKYCFQNRPWQSFDYEKALVQMINGLPVQYQEKAMSELVKKNLWENKLNESFKSQKLKDFAKQHGGLKFGKWSASSMNDLYNMTDEDFDDYVAVNSGEHYAKFGLNGSDNTGYTNNNFQPIEFGDGTFMVKRTPKHSWDDRAQSMIDKRFERYKTKEGDGRKRYRFENPYINKLVNGERDHDFEARGEWGFEGDDKLSKNQLNPKAIRQRHITNSYKGLEKYDKWGDNERGKYNEPKDSEKSMVNKAAKASPRHITRDNLREMVKPIIRKALMEGAYGYPDTVDGILLMSQNDRECYNFYSQIAKAVNKVYKRDANITFERLVDSSILKKYQQMCFKKYGHENPEHDRRNSPRIFREYIAKKIIDEVLNGQWDERQQMNEWGFPDVGFGDDGDNVTFDPREDYPEGKQGDIECAWDEDAYENDITPKRNDYYREYMEFMQNNRIRGKEWTPNEINMRNREMGRWIGGKGDEVNIEDSWEDAVHPDKVNESQQFDGSYGYQNVPDEFVEKVGENGYDVIVPEYCLPYLVNGDTEGYGGAEIVKMNNFLDEYQGKLLNGLNAGDCCAPMDNESPSFYRRNDVFGNIGMDCYRFFLPAK